MNEVHCKSIALLAGGRVLGRRWQLGFREEVVRNDTFHQVCGAYVEASVRHGC